MAQILVSLDGSARSEAILPHALTFARATSSDLILLKVTPPPEEAPQIGNPRWDDERKLSQNYLTTVAQRLRGMSVSIQTEVLSGDAGMSILSVIQQHPEVHLVTLTTRGRGVVGSWILGNVAKYVLHAATVPLLLLHPQEPQTREIEMHSVAAYHTLITFTDETMLDERVLTSIKTLALSQRVKVLLLAVSSLFNGSDPGEYVFPSPQEAVQQQQRRAGHLASQAQQIQSFCGVLVETAQAEEESAAWIERLLQDKQDMLVILPYQHYADHLAMQLLQHTNVPLLLIPQERRT